MNEKDFYLLSIVTIIWIFSAVIYLFEKTHTKQEVEEDDEDDDTTVVKRNFRTVHPDSRKYYNNLVNDDGTPYINEVFSTGK